MAAAKPDGYHARRSPSGAHRYMACAGAPTLGAQYPDVSSVYADEGTAAHMLGTMCLQGHVGPSDFINETIAVGERKFTVDKGMVEAVRVYVDYVRERMKGGSKTLLLEQDVPIGHMTGEDGATGKADAIIIDAEHRAIEVIDYKHGAGVKVSPVSNPQTLKYAAGAVYDHGIATDFEVIHSTIVQPRAGDGEPERFTVTIADLEAFVEEVKAAAGVSREADETFPGLDSPEMARWAATYLTPGEKQCRFCSARGPRCPAMTALVVEATSGEVATADDFADFVPDLVETGTVGPNYIAVAMAKVGLVEDWCKAVRAEAERMLTSGKDVPGWKLVEGKLGNRAWSSEAAAEAKLKGARLKLDEMYDRKLISPTTAEKLLKKDKPRVWAAVQECITRAPGKPSVAPASDPRPAISLVATADDFVGLATAE